MNASNFSRRRDVLPGGAVVVPPAEVLGFVERLVGVDVADGSVRDGELGDSLTVEASLEAINESAADANDSFEESSISAEAAFAD